MESACGIHTVLYVLYRHPGHNTLPNLNVVPRDVHALTCQGIATELRPSGILKEGKTHNSPR